ncbi:uncharacterized protein KY384_002374 [Bacidia gigantensis]|uniref:uncharacterized protein n=1 Tax=Bacidia gigantensis TaxID=2732470 RepID=UPI001D0496E2|nr:uncharacterized protein KY384_002374 [Bacidia gigantensis]KAG8532497.1 hypothetical protein KY384_002374 [Bacidia gigantensis]
MASPMLEILPTLLKRANDTVNNTHTGDFDLCVDITPECPVEATIYGYYPNLGANAFFLALFAACLVAHTYLGLRYKTWTYLIALWFGCLGEALGYAGRIILHHNPWDGNGFDIQICCLIICPAFFAAGVYLTLKHIVIELGPSYSHLPARWYTWIFILCDILSLVLQGAGGGIAATADHGSNMIDVGNDLMMAGIVWQVITLIVFGSLCTSYALRLRSNKNNLPPKAYQLLHTTRFRAFLGGLALAYITIFTRCVFRIAEMANGWKNSIMQDETDFIILEGVMIVIATLCLTIFHPGLVFPEMQDHKLKGLSGVTEQEVKEVHQSSPEDGSPLGYGRK